MPQAAIRKPRPGRLITIGLSVVVLSYLLSFLFGFWLKFSSPQLTQVLLPAVCSGIACWFAFRRGNTYALTWLVPMCMFLLIVITSVGYSILINSGKTGGMLHLIYWKILLWNPAKILLLHWVGYSFLSSGFCLYLIRSDAGNEQDLSISNRQSGIRCLFAATFAIATVLIVERLIINSSDVEETGFSVFEWLLMVIYPFNEILLPFGIGYAVASKGRHKLIGFAAIGLHVLFALCLSIWSILTGPFGTPHVWAQYFVYLLIARSLIIPAFLVSGYQFRIERRATHASIEHDATYDSILATENARLENVVDRSAGPWCWCSTPFGIKPVVHIGNDR